MYFNLNLLREVKKNIDGTEQVKVVWPKFKNGEATVFDEKVKPNFVWHKVKAKLIDLHNLQHRSQVAVTNELFCHNVCFMGRICGGYLPDISCCPGEKPAGGPTYEYHVGKASKGGGYNEKDGKQRKDSQR